mgnify:CR=1 FL=1
MQTRFFTFPDEATFLATAEAAGLMQEGVLVTAIHDYAIDVVGLIYKPTGKFIKDEDGSSYPEQAPIPGWHVNIACNDIHEAFAEYEVFPATPSRNFA